MRSNSGRVLDLTRKPIGAISPYLHKFGATKKDEFFVGKTSNYIELLEMVPGVRLELTRPILSNPRILSPKSNLFNILISIAKIKNAYRFWSGFGFERKTLTRHFAPTFQNLKNEIFLKNTLNFSSGIYEVVQTLR